GPLGERSLDHKQGNLTWGGCSGTRGGTMAFQRSPRLSAAVDLSTFLIGGVLATFGLASLIRNWSAVNPAFLLTIPCIVAIGLFPIRIHRLGGQMEFVSSPAVLMFLAFHTRPPAALLLWILGYA